MYSEQLMDFFRGDDHVLEVTFADDTGVPVNITGWAFKSTLKNNLFLDDEDSPVTVDIPPVSGLLAEQGILHIPYSHVDTEQLLPGTYFVDVQRELEGTVLTVVTGTAVVTGDATRRRN